MPHPMHSSSDILATLSAGDTSIQSLPEKECACNLSNIYYIPIFTTGQDLLHS